jgi:hypothetical protein
MVSNGSKFAPSPTNTVGNVFANGQLSVCGNLQLGKDGAGNDSQIVISVMNSNGVLGTDYTRLAILQGGVITCPDSVSNVLADTTLVVDITPGLSGSFAGETLTVVAAANNNFTAEPFDSVVFVGGSATVNYNNGSITLSNISSSPVPEPLTMCLLAIGGLGVLIRNRRK